MTPTIDRDKHICIGTHNGFFHADDCLAVAALSLCFNSYEVVRSRDQEILDACDIVVDVGGEYAEDIDRFDHHFFNGPTHDDGLLMSSFGLVWKKYGTLICGTEEIADSVCHQLVRPVDAADNGVSIHCRHRNSPYDVPILSLSGVISVMNPTDLKDCDERFLQMVSMARQIILAFIAQTRNKFEAREIVRYAYDFARKKDLFYLELPVNCKWEEALHQLDRSRNIIFVIFPQNNQWYLRCVSRKPNSFSCLRKLPLHWAGTREEDFSRISGIPDGVFCHHAAFICAAKSKLSILKLLKLAQELPNELGDGTSY